jgi:hypothetical protein
MAATPPGGAVLHCIAGRDVLQGEERKQERKRAVCKIFYQFLGERTFSTTQQSRCLGCNRHTVSSDNRLLEQLFFCSRGNFQLSECFVFPTWSATILRFTSMPSLKLSLYNSMAKEP